MMRINLVLIASLLFCGVFAQLGANSGKSWIGHGGNTDCTRYQKNGYGINSSKKVFSTGTPAFTQTNAPVSATPNIYKGRSTFPDWKGILRQTVVTTGAIVWERDIMSYYFNNLVYPGNQTRASVVQVDDKRIVVAVGAPAFVLLVDYNNGVLLGSFNASTDPNCSFTLLTGSGVVEDERYLYQPVSTTASFAQFPCCKCTGHLLKIDLNTMSLMWDYRTIPASVTGLGKFSGASVWMSGNPISKTLNSVFITTGQNHNAPLDYQNCIISGNSSTWDSCNYLQPGYSENYFVSFIRIDKTLGVKQCATRALPFDVWNIACSALFPPGNPLCPVLDAYSSRDFDMHTGVTLEEDGHEDGRPRGYTGNKGGSLFKWFADTCEVEHVIQVSPGGSLGGVGWGLAVDKKEPQKNHPGKVYFTIINEIFAAPITVSPLTLSNATTVPRGGWGSVNKYTFGNLEVISNPANYDPTGFFGNNRVRTAHSHGPPCVVDDVVFIVSADSVGTFNNPAPAVWGNGGFIYQVSKYNMSNIIDSVATGAGGYGGCAAADGSVCCGHGYRAPPLFGITNTGPLYHMCWHA